MGTRSIIATTRNTKTFTGTYAHWDGNPRAMLRALAAIITRDAADAPRTLTAHTWSTINPHTPAPDTPLPHPTREQYLATLHGTPPDPGVAVLYSQIALHGEADGRSHLIAGYGTTSHGAPVRFSGTIANYEHTGWCEWAYIIDTDLGITVYEIDDQRLIDRGHFTLDDLAAITRNDPTITARLEAAECGTDYSRCSHYAWVHDRTVPDASRRLGMQTWIGARPLDPGDAIGMTCDGEEHRFTGSSHYLRDVCSQQIESGRYVDVYNTQTRQPGAGIELIYPPTRATLSA